MLSERTFKKMNKLTNMIEQEDKEEKTATLEEYAYLNLLATISGEYQLIKVKDENTHNYHFELQKAG
jgi:hypothetical protein